MSARARHVKNILRVVLLLLVATGIAFTIEYSRIRDGTETTGRIVAKHRKPHGGGPFGDPYEIVIEYRAPGQHKRFATSRAIWDMSGKLNSIGATVPVWYLDDGRASINRFSYLYPITLTLLGLTTIGAISALFVPLVIPQSHHDVFSSRVRRYQDAKNRPHQHLSANRKLLLSRLHRLLLMLGGALGLIAIGILRSSVWSLIAALVGVILWLFAIRRMLVCPHCGASLVEALKEIEPRITTRTNWLIVRDYLAKGVPVICRSCGRSLDD